jgi:uncharacterized protein DUF4440
MTLFVLATLLAAAPSPDDRAFFEKTEQALMDAVATGDKKVWDAVLDDVYVATGEEGEVIDRKKFLDDLAPLPTGLSGNIAVKELTVQQFPAFAVVRYLADETEDVFGQKLATKYRTTDTYRRVGAAWKLMASHTSVVTQDPPAQPVESARWEQLAGKYQLVPNGWTFQVVFRDGKLYGGRDPAKLKPFVPMAPDAFVLSGSLGEWLFARDPKGRATRIVELRKFEPLVWTRIVP